MEARPVRRGTVRRGEGHQRTGKERVQNRFVTVNRDSGLLRYDWDFAERWRKRFSPSRHHRPFVDALTFPRISSKSLKFRPVLPEVRLALARMRRTTTWPSLLILRTWISPLPWLHSAVCLLKEELW